MHRTTTFLLQVAAIVFALLRSDPASADAKADARVQVIAADKHFKLGLFVEALDEYSKAYQLYPAPPLLFNIGQCHRNLKDWEKAIFFFEGFLSARPDAKNRRQIEDLIRESQVELGKQRADEARRKAEDAKTAEDARMAAEAEAARRAAEQNNRVRPGDEATVGVVVMGEPTMHAPVLAQVQGWLQDHRYALIAAPFATSESNRLVDCLVIEDMTCARAVFESESRSDTVVVARVETGPGNQTREVGLTTYWFVRDRAPVVNNRACKACRDEALHAAVSSMMEALAQSSGVGVQRLEAAHRLERDQQIAVTRRAEDERVREGRAERGREREPVYRTWWFWSAVGAAALAVGGTAYYFSGTTTVVEPMGSLGGSDWR